MQLIAISENILINPELIESIEIIKVNERNTFIINIGGKSHVPTKDPDELLALLISGGMKMHDQFFSV